MKDTHEIGYENEKGKDKNFTSNQETFIETFEMLASHNGGNSKVSEDELRKHMRKKLMVFQLPEHRSPSSDNIFARGLF